jgi:hypothetical protein
MKTRTLIYVIILFSAVTLLFAEDVKRTISETEFFEIFSGTWVNEDYLGGAYYQQKIINYSDGRWELYDFIPDKEYDFYGKYTMDDMWVDSNGDIWFKARWEFLVHGYKYFLLGKISNSVTVLEIVYQESRYPTEINPIEGMYNIRYRQ